MKRGIENSQILAYHYFATLAELKGEKIAEDYWRSQVEKLLREEDTHEVSIIDRILGWLQSKPQA